MVWVGASSWDRSVESGMATVSRSRVYREYISGYSAFSKGTSGRESITSPAMTPHPCSSICKASRGDLPAFKETEAAREAAPERFRRLCCKYRRELVQRTRHILVRIVVCFDGMRFFVVLCLFKHIGNKRQTRPADKKLKQVLWIFLYLNPEGLYRATL